MRPEPPATLARVMGRWTLAALVVNCIIGSGIFGLPDDLARLLGPHAPWAYLIAAAATAVLIAIYAELGSQFAHSGGIYLYAREAFGRFAGIQAGWFVWLVRLTSAAANANLFVIYLGEFWPAATDGVIRAAILTVLLGGLTAVNVMGISAGARLSNVFTIAKLTPLFLLIAGGLMLPIQSAPAAVDPVVHDWAGALIVLMFAFGGFDTALIPMAEAKQPARDVPFALGVGLAVTTGVYVLLQIVAQRTVPELATSERPLADAARTLIGPTGAALIAVGAMLSTYGFLAGQLVAVPRLTFAFGERGDFPALFARVHPTFRTPYISILFWGVLVVTLAISGNFLWNAVLSVAARLMTYLFACPALIALRRRNSAPTGWRAPGGTFLAVLGLGFCGVLIFQMNWQHAAIMAVIAGIAAANWFVVRNHRSAEL